MVRIIIFILILAYIGIVGTIVDLFTRKDITPTPFSFMLAFCPVVNLYTFIKYIIIMREHKTAKGKGMIEQFKEEMYED